MATEIQFKIIERDKHRRFNGELDAIRRNATPQRNNDRPVATTGVHYRHKQVGVLRRKDGNQTGGIHDLRLHSSKVAGNLFGINEPWQGTFIPMGGPQAPVNSKARFLHLLQPRLYDFFINFRVSFST